MDITKLDGEIKKVIISSYIIGTADGCINNFTKTTQSEEQVLEYLNNLINPIENEA